MLILDAIISAITLDSVEDDWRASLVKALESLKGVADPAERVALSSQVMQALRTLVNRDVIGSLPVSATAKPNVINGSNVAELLASARAYAISNFAGKSVTNESDGSRILISKSGIEHALSRRSGIIDALVATDLENLLVRASYLRSDADKSGRKDIKAAHFYGAKVDIGNKIADVGIVVREHSDGRRYYDHFELKTKSPAKAGDSGAALDGASGAATSAAMEELGHRPRSKADVNLYAEAVSVKADPLYKAGCMLILDSIPPIERIKLSAALAKAVTQLRSEEAPLARVRLSRDVAAILAELGAGSAPSLKFSLKDKAASAESIKAYAAQMRLPESLARFERQTLGSLAETIGDLSLADVVVGSRSPASDEQHLAAFNEIASRGVTPPIDRERVLSRIAESNDLLKGSVRTAPAVVELDDKINELNSSFTESATRLRAQMREEGADRAALSDKLYDLNVQYKADFEKLKNAHIAAQREFHAEKAAKALELFKEDGEKVINTLMAASPITEQQATAWASQQVVDKKALAKLSRLGYKKDDLFRDMAEFYRLTGGKASTVRISTDGGRRANAVGVEARLDEKVINLGSHFNKTILFHELAHHLENDPIAKAASNGFLVKRREGSQPYSLRSLSGNRGYHASEVAYKDAFMDAYVGKVYRDGVTEVFSMGVQYLSNPKDAAIFAAKDPEMFAMVTGYLAGNLTPAMEAKLHMHSGAIDTLQEERKEEDQQYKKALVDISTRITLTKDDWWDRAKAADRDSEEGRVARQLDTFAFPKRTSVKYLGSWRGEFRVFEGIFRNRNTSRNAKGYLVARGTSDGSIPEYAAVHGGIDLAKALIAAAESQGGASLRSVWINTFYEGAGRNPKKALIKTSELIAGEAQ